MLGNVTGLSERARVFIGKELNAIDSIVNLFVLYVEKDALLTSKMSQIEHSSISENKQLKIDTEEVLIKVFVYISRENKLI